MKSLKNALQVVVGLGTTGFASAEYLIKQGYPVVILDTREKPPGLVECQQHYPNIPIHLGDFDPQFIEGAERIILSPGISPHDPLCQLAKQKGIPILGDIELFAQQVSAPIIAITGTNGKSTVTQLVGDMAEQAGCNVKVGGNIGVPALALLDDEVADLYVLELSSFQLETTHSLKPHAATILNISDDHLDRHHDMDAYTEIKQRIYQQTKWAIYNREQQATYPTHVTNTMSFGSSEPMNNEFGIRTTSQGTFLAYEQENLLAVDKMVLQGKQNWMNALAALALGYVSDLPMTAMLQAATTFSGLPHRCQHIRTFNEVAWYNDSKATNVGACIAALSGLGESSAGKIVLIAGGQGKQADFTPLQKIVSEHVRALVLIGEDASLIAQAVTHTTPIHYASSMQEAVDLARQQAQSGDCVLLSPACASFDMFDNFMHRGRVFESIVREL